MRSRVFLLLIASQAAVAACDSPGRPLPPEVGGDVVLQVEVVSVVSPISNQSLLAGDPAVVLVRAQEQAGRLTGIGFVARRSGPDALPLDSVVVRFDPLADTTVAFTMQVPPTMTHNSQIDFYGLAFGPAAENSVSAARHMIVLVCPPGGAIWC